MKGWVYKQVYKGKNVHIGPFSLIGQPAECYEVWQRYPTIDNYEYSVEIGDNTIITGMCTIDAGTIRHTKIGKNCFIMKQVHIGHDATIGDRVTIAPGAVVGGHVVIYEGAYIGMKAVIHQRQIIPPFAMLGANSFLPKGKEMKPFEIWAGSPARFLKINEVAIKRNNFTSKQINEYREQWESLKLES